ncbi:type I polyketide synthase [Nocardia arizonensis]|uniref:type I polyketide synthase n=3 Tax=Nocardia arizonensis TaxID=1141647 RepID=UPI0006CFBBE0|nr:type I polyketide synthase [Nocardia arizonensis]
MNHPNSDDGVRATARRLADNPIAIVGLSGLFPMARNVREFWQNITDAVDCTSEVPPSRWNLDDYYDEDPTAPDKTYCRRGGFLPEVPFSATEFRVPPNQLEVTTVVQLLSLLVARDVLADAGAIGSDWYRPQRTGVVLGVAGPTTLSHPLAARLSTPVLKEVVRSCGLTQSDAERIAEKYTAAFAPWEENSFPGLLGNVIAGRVANRLDLGGMNCTVDAACASSLSAVHVAISELVSGRADMMITGGCDTENSIFGYMCFSKVGALSRSGVIKPLDDAADGTLVGEGIGMLALKRLEDARRDGDRVYAVIRGMGSSSDGRFKSIYAPRAEGQQAALRRAYEDADCSPASVELFEAHATGTTVGDHTELTALTAVLREETGETGYAAIGSVKSQIGHTKGAAGAASLIKLALALHHKVLPPTINVTTPNRALDEKSPFYVNTRTRPWIRDPRRPRRRASASAMGFGGTNFHVVLEETNSDRNGPSTLHRGARVHLWHAADVAELVHLLRSGTPPNGDAGIPAEHARIGFVARGEHEAETLRALAADELSGTRSIEEFSHPKGILFRLRAMPDLKIGALFAGQGSQYVNMGLTALLNNPTVATAFDEANAVFTDSTRPLASVVFPPPVFDPEQRIAQEATLRRTDYAQPAIAALSVGQYRFLTERGLRCAGFMGHSFGELTALWAAGALEDADLFTLAKARGDAMAACDPDDGIDTGTMAAVETSREQITEILREHSDVDICNHNAPDQVVVGGGTAAVAELVAACRKRGLTVRELSVSGAFHTRYVAHAVEPFRKAVKNVTVRAPRSPVYANSEGGKYGARVATNRRVLTEQLLRTVEFVRGLEAMRADGCTVFVEFGPKSVLTQFVRRTLGEGVVAIATDRGPAGDSDVALKKAALNLAVLGAPITDLHRHDAAPLTARAAEGMVVQLTGHDYVADTRRDRYRAAIAEPTVLEAVAQAEARGVAMAETRTPTEASAPRSYEALPPSETPVPDQHTEPSWLLPAVDAHRNGRHEVRPEEIARQHLILHDRYTEGQLEITRELVNALREAQRSGTADGRLHDTVHAITEQSLAIGRAHTRVNEILDSLTALERDVSPAVLPTYEHNSDGTVSTDDEGAGAVTLPEAPLPTGHRSGIGSANGHTDVARESGPGAVGLSVPAQVGVAGGVVNGVVGVEVSVVESVLVGVVAEKTGYPVEMLDMSMDLEADLGVDSIKRVQILGALAERIDGVPAVGTERAAELRTLGDIVGFVVGADVGVAGGVVNDVVEVEDSAVEVPRPADIAPTLLRIERVRLPAIDSLAQPFADGPVALIVDCGDNTAGALAAHLEADGWTVHMASVRAGNDSGVSTWDGSAVHDALAVPVEQLTRLDLCVMALPADRRWHVSASRLADAVFTAKLVHNRLEKTAAAGTRAAFVTVTRIDGALGHRGDRTAAESVVGGVSGLVKTLAREAPTLFCRTVDLSPRLDDEVGVAMVVAELADAAADIREVAIDADRARWTLVPSPVDATTEDEAESTLTEDDVLVVTGGGRGVTAWCVRELAARRSCTFVLLGRTVLTDEPWWASGIADDDLKRAAIEALRAAGDDPTPGKVDPIVRDLLAQREIRSTLDAVTRTGAAVRYLAVDITDADATKRILAEYDTRATGIVHGAGALADRLLATKTAADISTVLSTKLDGLHNVVTALANATLRHVILFGSVAGVLGNPGQADYAVANEALNRVAMSWKRHGHADRITTINWGAWDGGMVTPELREVFVSRGIPLLSPDVGARMFAAQFTPTRAADVSVLIGPPTPLAPADPIATAPFTAHRDLGALADDPVVNDHRVGRFPVLPATAGLGWAINVLEHANPGLRVIECSGFEVLKGIVFDGGCERDYRLDVSAGAQAGGRLTIEARIRGSESGATTSPSYFAGTFVLASEAAPAPVMPGWPEYPTGQGPEDGLEVYQDAYLFHGPLLQGVRRLIQRRERQLVVECRLPATPIGGGNYAGALHNPVLSDVVVQAGSLLGVWFLGAGCLPLAVGRIEYYAPLPDDSPFIAVVDDLRPHPNAPQVMVTVSACDVHGRVLQRYRDLTVVATREMTAKFSEAVRLRERG